MRPLNPITTPLADDDVDDDFRPLTLPSGTRIQLSTWEGTSPLFVQTESLEGSRDRVEFAYPNAGLGGGHFVLSPSCRYLVVSMYSGQSEEGYELFDLAQGLTRLEGFGYVFGMMASYAFSPDESQLVMALPMTCSEWWYLWEDAEPEARDASRWGVEFGNLYVRDIATGAVSRHQLRVSAPVDWTPPEAKYDARWHPRFVAHDSLALQMPWGEIELAFPLAAVTTLRAEDAYV